jgi:hypothetical protein
MHETRRKVGEAGVSLQASCSGLVCVLDCGRRSR